MNKVQYNETKSPGTCWRRIPGERKFFIMSKASIPLAGRKSNDTKRENT